MGVEASLPQASGRNSSYEPAQDVYWKECRAQAAWLFLYSPLVIVVVAVVSATRFYCISTVHASLYLAVAVFFVSFLCKSVVLSWVSSTCVCIPTTAQHSTVQHASEICCLERKHRTALLASLRVLILLPNGHHITMI